MRSGYREFGLELVSLEENLLLPAQEPSHGGIKEGLGAGYPFKLLLEESLARQRNEMMYNISQILR
jgi:hypothetical protein